MLQFIGICIAAIVTARTSKLPEAARSGRTLDPFLVDRLLGWSLERVDDLHFWIVETGGEPVGGDQRIVGG